MATRLRKIAILLASVDADTAQQILLLLPSELAAQARELIPELGPISLAEKQALVDEFHQLLQATAPAAGSSTSDGPEPSWTELSTEAIAGALSDERPPVIALIIGRLAATKAVAVLEQLDRDVSCEAVRLLSTMQPNPQLELKLDRVLAAKLGNCQVEIDRLDQHAQRVNRLIEQAPEELKQSWQNAIESAAGAPEDCAPEDCVPEDSAVEANVVEDSHMFI